MLDDGAVKGVSDQGRSLLHPSALSVSRGIFSAVIWCPASTAQGRGCARAFEEPLGGEAKRWLRASADDRISLGLLSGEEELIHRDNLVGS